MELCITLYNHDNTMNKRQLKIHCTCILCSPFLDEASYDTECIVDGTFSFIYHQFVGSPHHHWHCLHSLSGSCNLHYIHTNLSKVNSPYYNVMYVEFWLPWQPCLSRVGPPRRDRRNPGAPGGSDPSWLLDDIQQSKEETRYHNCY